MRANDSIKNLQLGVGNLKKILQKPVNVPTHKKLKKNQSCKDILDMENIEQEVQPKKRQLSQQQI